MDVAGVKANADATLVVHEGDDVAQVFKRRAHHVAAPGHGFQHGRHGLRGGVGAVEGGGDAGDGRGAGAAAGPAWVEVVESDAEGFAAFEVIEEGGVGLSGFVLVFLGEVDEVGAVGEDVTVVEGKRNQNDLIGLRIFFFFFFFFFFLGGRAGVNILGSVYVGV